MIWMKKSCSCSALIFFRPPGGCDQYYTTLTGRIMTFNFKSTTTGHLASQE